MTERMTEVTALLAGIIGDRAFGGPLVVAVRGSGAPASAGSRAPHLADGVRLDADGPTW